MSLADRLRGRDDNGREIVPIKPVEEMPEFQLEQIFGALYGVPKHVRMQPVDHIEHTFGLTTQAAHWHAWEEVDGDLRTGGNMRQVPCPKCSPTEYRGRHKR